ncbi:hypothetical protein BGZ73_000536, partial [Actinomortierella ambigua]
THLTRHCNHRGPDRLDPDPGHVLGPCHDHGRDPDDLGPCLGLVHDHGRGRGRGLGHVPDLDLCLGPDRVDGRGAGRGLGLGRCCSGSPLPHDLGHDHGHGHDRDRGLGLYHDP